MRESGRRRRGFQPLQIWAKVPGWSSDSVRNAEGTQLARRVMPPLWISSGASEAANFLSISSLLSGR
jgi:hypothetical protein